MYNIALYNFGDYDLEIIVALLERFRDYTGTRLKMKPYSSGIDLIETHLTYNILFVDLSTNRESALKIGFEFLRKNTQGALIFVSDTILNYQDGFRVGADRFFVKPIVADQFITEMQAVFARVSHHLNAIKISESQETLVSIDDVLYITTDNRRVLFMTNRGPLYSRETFSFWHEFFMDTGLILCARGSLVNLRYIRSIGQTMITLNDGKRIPVSRRMRTSVVRRFSRFQAS